MLVALFLFVAAAQDIGHRLPSAEIARLEAALLRNPHDLSTRARLMTHYFQDAVSQPRVAHVLWIVEHHPGSKLAGSPVASVTRSDLLNTRSDYEAARLLWLKQIEVHARDASVLGNASRFFSEEEPQLAEELLIRAWELDGENKMRRAALVSFYTQVLAECTQAHTSRTRCLDSAWVNELKAKLARIAPPPAATIR